MSNAPRIPITDDNLTGPEPLCSYVRAYFEARGLGVGDTWVAHEYINWISDKHDQFSREVLKEPRYCGYTPHERAAFERFIREVTP